MLGSKILASMAIRSGLKSATEQVAWELVTPKLARASLHV